MPFNRATAPFAAALLAATLALSAPVLGLAQSGTAASQTAPTDADDQQRPSAKPPARPNYRQPGADGVVRGDPVVEPGDPGFKGPPPPPRQPRPPKPPASQTPAVPAVPSDQPPSPPSPPTPAPPQTPPSPAPAPARPTPPPRPPFVPPKPVLVDPPVTAPQPAPVQPPRPTPQPPVNTPPARPSPSPGAPEPPEAIGEDDPAPTPPAPQPQPPAPKPPPQQPPPSNPPAPQPQPAPAPMPPPGGLIDSGLQDALGRTFTYYAPGNLRPGSSRSGTGGVTSATIFAPDMRYPIEAAPSFPNSQVYGHGGYLGPGGGQCTGSNYSYPWRDNFCEARGYDTPVCPAGKGHQGQDIRPPTCKDALHWVVAVENGVITSIGGYAVKLKGDSGREYTYLHMRMNALSVTRGQMVRRGQRIGKVSTDFAGTPTTIHLHFEIKANVALPGRPAGFRKVPPYTSLVDSYKRLLQGSP